MNNLIENLVAFHIVLGAFFVLIGSVGLIKLPSLMERLHAPSKATTLGVGGCLIASMIQLWGKAGVISMQEVLITMFLFITAPVTAHFLAKAYLHLQPASDRQLPQPESEHGWSTLESSERNDSVL